MDKKTRQSIRFCHRVTRTQARNFYYGLKLTPREHRAALYVVYAFMRACDDLADGVDGAEPPQVSQAAARIEDFRQRMQQAMDDPASVAQEPAQSVWPAFAWMMARYKLDPALLHAMLDGQRSDLLPIRYRSFEELYGYCYNVAGVVGLVCVHIWGVTDKSAFKLAEYRGVALQLTNILRDLAEDGRRGRIYLPQDDFERFGLSPSVCQAVDADTLDDAFDRFMAFQIERARSYYAMSAQLEQFITPDCRPTSLAIMRIYRALLEEIAQDPRRVMTRRVSLSRWRKCRIMLGAWLRR